ncbi:hypothetical protein B0H16DRAFT_1884822 [Mycena metata]|uniref:Uncharacterized protein n=1 Tax=Mycena metata TaxID=1033252 RepID=A0AAD7JCW2_9AGAR|nr:hypothetical protein B0H16DRAFT_1884822 [Mycena metata]
MSCPSSPSPPPHPSPSSLYLFLAVGAFALNLSAHRAAFAQFHPPPATSASPPSPSPTSSAPSHSLLSPSTSTPPPQPSPPGSPSLRTPKATSPFAAEARKNYARAGAAVSAAFWHGMGHVGVRRPTAGLFAAASTTSSGSKGMGYQKPKSVPLALAVLLLHIQTLLALHSGPQALRVLRLPVGADAEKGRVAHEEEHEEPDVSVSSVYSADGHVDVHTTVPASATSFTSSSSSTAAGSAYAYALPLHVGWHDAAYPASPTSAGEHEPTEAWSPASDAQHSMIDVRTQQQQDTAARGRALV